MRGFRTRLAVEQVHALIEGRVGRLGLEAEELRRSSGRVLGEAIRAHAAFPPFDRAAMDGYAVRGEETFGADVYNPVAFRLIGRARPGRAFAGEVGAGEAAEIATGAPLPPGADTVVKAESASVEGEVVRVTEPTPPGRHVGRRGEDLAEGAEVLAPGRVLRPQDLGLLSALGLAAIPVVRRPRVTILVTGDELLPAGSAPSGHRFADMNSVMLSALIERDGGDPTIVGPLADDREGLRSALLDAAKGADAVLVSGGSSTGPEDHAPSLVAEMGDLPVHGVALRPASPTGVGFLDGVPIVLLPGNPVSCLCGYDFFAGRIVRELGGRPPVWPYRSTERPLARKLTSALGRVDYARVRLREGLVEPLAISGASILSSTTRSDGFVIVPAELEGYPAGHPVKVFLYDAIDPEG
jgi:molybdopterin molybdotransferase